MFSQKYFPWFHIINFLLFPFRWLCAIASSINRIVASPLATINWFRYLALVDVQKINRPIHGTGWAAKEICNRTNPAAHRNWTSRAATITAALECIITINRIWVNSVAILTAIWPWILRTICITPLISVIHSIHLWFIKHIAGAWLCCEGEKGYQRYSNSLLNSRMCRAKAIYRYLWAKIVGEIFFNK